MKRLEQCVYFIVWYGITHKYKTAHLEGKTQHIQTHSMQKRVQTQTLTNNHTPTIEMRMHYRRIVYTYNSARACTHAHTHPKPHLHVRLHIYTKIHTRIHLQAYAHTHTHTQTHTHTHTHRYTHTHTHTHTYAKQVSPPGRSRCASSR
jgi:hypothetical protein